MVGAEASIHVESVLRLDDMRKFERVVCELWGHGEFALFWRGLARKRALWGLLVAVWLVTATALAVRQLFLPFALLDRFTSCLFLLRSALFGWLNSLAPVAMEGGTPYLTGTYLVQQPQFSPCMAPSHRAWLARDTGRSG